jgi:NADH-quinone oxidoreductase subunit G
MATITVDGTPLEVPDGSMLLPVLLEHGVQIPHYCFHPKLSIDGSCRMCLVKVEGMPKLTISCNTPVRDGMVVDTRGPEVANARKGVIELLLLNHPLDCPICDQAGECYLQDYAYEYGTREARTREPRRKLLKRVDVGPRVVLDQERCILCRRCVRFCSEITKTRELAVFNMGDESVLDTFPGEPLANDYSICTADICPVGALLSKDFHHKMRVWFLDETESVCPGCANGCNVKVGVARREVQRLLPRRNDAVNDTWMCDAGRLGYRFVNEGRLRAPRIAREGAQVAVGWDEALDEAATRLGALARGESAVAAIVSPHLTNEELFVLRQLVEHGLRARRHDVAIRIGAADDLLIKAEKAANGRGARDLGLGTGTLDAIAADIEAGTVRGLFVTGVDLWEVWGAGRAAALLGRLGTLVVQTSNAHPLADLAHVVLPGLTFAEKRGTFTNEAGRVQRIERALDPEEQPSDGEIFLRLGRRLGMELPPGAFDPRAVLGEIARAVPAYAELTWDDLGSQGRATGAA